MPQLPLPLHLGHQSVFSMPYFDHDGSRAGATDCQHLSVGRAQYDSYQISAKLFRHTDNRWSRQSEEMPLDRLFDLATFTALSLLHHQDDSFTIPAGFFENQSSEIVVSRVGREQNGLRRDSFSKLLSDDKHIRASLSRLRRVLQEVEEANLIEE